MRVDPQKRFGQRECPSCAVTVSENENRCPICGYEFPNRTPMAAIRVGAALLLLFLLLFVFVL